ncbi:uncharacterized protein BX663DRAFT_468343 [Cokeromyces recurvatus]|uniref:uncharacterized protein n=1 Tax=Cokeromyces recurvatus TaxID=90255 RepID=UPI0022212007|nr:uncharacterized protein BX663DRAFT_468343 [Cokeromyces recurvatus]KAI7905655.1 hypothetical protein BX663DRAFT_468343 [Cokeromyces recurvatus]
MRHCSLSEELDAMTKEFDYGIVPGSAAVFVNDEINGIGRLDLTLLEGVMIVLEVNDQGYKVTSCSPLCNVDPAISAAQTVEAHLERPFESMENLLMTISPMFREKFQQELYNKLQNVQQQQTNIISMQHPSLYNNTTNTHIPYNNATATTTTTTTTPITATTTTTTTNLTDDSTNSLENLNNWINN